MTKTLTDFLSSINTTKNNLIEMSDYPDEVIKDYPGYVVARCLSAHWDCVLLVNELNIRGGPSYGLSPQAHYEFLLQALPKGKRFAKLGKAVAEEDVLLISKHLNYSISKARDVVDLFTKEQLTALRNAEGGVQQGDKRESAKRV